MLTSVDRSSVKTGVEMASASMISSKNYIQEAADLQEVSMMMRDEAAGNLIICSSTSSSSYNNSTKSHPENESRNVEIIHFSKLLHDPCKPSAHLCPPYQCGSADIASASGKKMERLCDQTNWSEREHKSDDGLCNVNKQEWEEIDWLQGIPRKETAQKEKHQIKEDDTSFLRQPSLPDRRNRLLLPPKKRICMNMELTAAAESEEPIPGIPAEGGELEKREACMDHSFGRRNDNLGGGGGGGSERTVKGTVAKSPRWLHRRYKLLSEIV